MKLAWGLQGKKEREVERGRQRGELGRGDHPAPTPVPQEGGRAGGGRGRAGIKSYGGWMTASCLLVRRAHGHRNYQPALRGG